MIKFGSKVKMHYSISNLDGVKFESTFEKEPVTFTVGDGLLPQNLEIPLYGLNENEEQSISLDPNNAFGYRDETKIKTIKKALFPKQSMIKIGNVLEFDVKTKDGKRKGIILIKKDCHRTNISFF